MRQLIRLLPILLLIGNCAKENVTPPETDNECSFTLVQQSLVSSLDNDAAYPFSDSDPETDATALAPLIDYLGEARVVGLGEGTHGTADFYEMKDKIFRQLVTDKGFKAIVFEIPWGNALVVNDYVFHGIGNVDAALDQTYYWVYNTEEVKQLVEWMRTYNRDRPVEERIYFVGNDPQGGDFRTEVARLRTYLERVAPDTAQNLLDGYAQLPVGGLFEYHTADPAVHAANEAGTARVLDYLNDEREALIGQSSELEYEIALMAADVIVERERLYRLRDYGVPRDRLMAKYTERWQSILGADIRVAVWAHNNHVLDGRSVGQEWMGTFLNTSYGSDYRKVGFSFGSGTFNAALVNNAGDVLAGAGQRSIRSAPCSTVNQLLSQLEATNHYLIFDELDAETRAYFLERHDFLQVGSVYNPGRIFNYVRELPLARVFDVVIHFDETRRSELR